MPSPGGEYEFRSDLLTPQEIQGKFTQLLDGKITKTFEVSDGTRVTLTNERSCFAMQIAVAGHALYDLTFNLKGVVNDTATVFVGEGSTEGQQVQTKELPIPWQSILSAAKPLQRDPFETLVSLIGGGHRLLDTKMRGPFTPEKMTFIADALDALERRQLDEELGEDPEIKDDAITSYLAGVLVQASREREQLAAADPNLTPLDFGCSIMWHRACDELQLPMRKFSAVFPSTSQTGPIPADLKATLHDSQLERIMVVSWRDEDWLIVDLASRRGRPYVGEKIDCDKLMSLILVRASHFQGL